MELVIDKNAIKHNIEVIRRKTKKMCKLIAVIKSNCYGFGYELIPQIESCMINEFLVFSFDEAIQARKYTTKPIYIFDTLNMSIDQLLSLENLNFIPIIQKIEHLQLPIKCVINFETGLNRFGINLTDYSPHHNAKILWVMTHLIATYSPTLRHKLYEEQLMQLKNIAQKLHIPYGITSSGCAYIYGKDSHETYSRIGQLMYGYSRGSVDFSEIKPIIAGLYVKIIHKIFLKRGDYLGYDRSYQVQHDGWFVIINAGYVKQINANMFFIDNKFRSLKPVGSIFMDVAILHAYEDNEVGETLNLKQWLESTFATPFMFLSSILHHRQIHFIN